MLWWHSGPTPVTGCVGSVRVWLQMTSMILAWTVGHRRTDGSLRLPGRCGVGFSIRQQLNELAYEADQIVEKWRAALKGSSWTRECEEAVSAYESLRERLEAGGAGDPSAYGELVQRRHSIEQRLDELEGRKAQAASPKEDANASLERLVRIRRELTAARCSFLDQVLANNPYVRISVVPYGERESTEAEFRKLIHKEDGRFKKDLIGSQARPGLIQRILGPGPEAAQVEDTLRHEKRMVRSIAESSGNSPAVVDQ